MNVLYLGSFFPESRYDEIVSNSLDVIQNAGDTYQKAIIAGLSQHIASYKIITSPMIGSFPSRYNNRIFNGSTFNFKNQKGCICCEFNNLTLYKIYSRYISAKEEVKKWVLNTNGQKYIIVYSLDLSLLKAVCELKSKYTDIKICLIITDLFRFMLPPKSIFSKYIMNYSENKSQVYNQFVDCFVLMTKFMEKDLKVNKRPYVVVEGIFDSQYNNRIVYEKEHYKTIFYSGIIAKQFGIIHLLDAFSKIKNDDYRLWICGEGDGKEEIILRAVTDSRIKYFGQLKREEVLLLQKKVTVLINPRLSNDEFTMYSFPSKTIEYLTSGTPAIMHPLKCLPKEYIEHLFIAYDESDNGLASTIIEVCERTQQELDFFGKKGIDFILNEKNSKVQVGKILEMINYEK